MFTFGVCHLEYSQFSYRPQRSWAKVLFLQASVILLTVGCLSQCMLGYTPLGADPPRSRPPGSRHPPEADPLQADPPGSRPSGTDTPRSRHPPRSRPPPGSRLQHTVYKWPVRIILECILVIDCIPSSNIYEHQM